MESKTLSFRPLAWALVNLALLAAACAWWGWLDYRYVTEYWTGAEMREAVGPIPLVTAVAAMALNLWLLRNRSAALHLLGSLAAAVAVTAAWWALVTYAGGFYHEAIGGTLG